MRIVLLLIATIALAGCVDTKADLQTQSEQERGTLRSLYNSTENNRDGLAPTPFD